MAYFLYKLEEEPPSTAWKELSGSMIKMRDKFISLSLLRHCSQDTPHAPNLFVAFEGHFALSELRAGSRFLPVEPAFRLSIERVRACNGTLLSRTQRNVWWRLLCARSSQAIRGVGPDTESAVSPRRRNSCLCDGTWSVDLVQNQFEIPRLTRVLQHVSGRPWKG